MINKKMFVFDIEYAGKDKTKITPNKQLVKIAKIMSPGQTSVQLRELFTYITLYKKDLIYKKGIDKAYLDKLARRKSIFDNIKVIYDIKLNLTSNNPYFTYASNTIYYIDFAYDVLNFKVDEDNKIHDINNSGVVSSAKNTDFIPNMAKMCAEISKNQNSIVASYNVGTDYGRIMIALSCKRFLSEDDLSGTGASTSIDTLLQLSREKKILDIRKVFIKLFSVKKGSKDEVDLKYARWCIEHGYITRALNIKTQLEQLINHYRNLYKEEFKNTSLISSNEYKQSHTAKKDVEDLVDLIKVKTSYGKLNDWTIYFDILKEDKLETDFTSIQLKNLFGKDDYQKELANNGYIIYGVEKRNFSELDDSDIDKILEIPSNTKIRGYIDSTAAVLDLIEHINGIQFNSNKERMSYLKEKLKVLKGNQKKVDEKNEFKKRIDNHVTEGIKDITVSKLLENEILSHTQNQNLEPNIVNRIRFLLYYFLEQQKLIEFVKFLGEFYHEYIHVIRTEKEIDDFNNAVELGYTGVIEFIKKKQKDEGTRMLAEALGQVYNDGGEFTSLSEAQVDFNKSRTKATKSMASLIKASTSITDLSTAMKRAITIALLEDKAGKALKNSNGGAHYDARIGDNAGFIGLDVMLYAKTSTTKSSNIANTLAIYYSFVPGNAYLYIAFSRLYGAKKYKSYLYHGVQYNYYLNILEEIAKTGTLGSAAWNIRRMNFKGRALIESGISGKTKFYQAISGEDKTKAGNTASPHAKGVISSFEQYKKNRGKAGKISQISLNDPMFDEDKLQADAMLVTAFYNEAISLFTGSGKN